MLIEFTITNFAIIDALHLRLGPHLNVFTGETGAGKSIIVDAISALVGERAGAEVVRAGADRAVVEGVFDVSRLLAARGWQARRRQTRVRTSAESATARRSRHAGRARHRGRRMARSSSPARLARTGRGLARVNGRAVPVSALQRIAGFLIDIHGQSAHLDPAAPRTARLLSRPLRRDRGAARRGGDTGDRVARRAARAMSGCNATSARWSGVSNCCATRWMRSRPRASQPGELDDLERERKRLANAERLGELECGGTRRAQRRRRLATPAARSIC